MTWSQVHAYRLERHHLTRKAPNAGLVDVVGAIGGAQAQLMSAAEMQIGVRVDCRVSDVRDALWKDRTLVKTWLMRGTLHLVPAADLQLYSAAMRTRWIKTRNTWLTFLDLSEAELTKLVAAIGEALGPDPQTRDELIAKVGSGRSERIRLMLGSGWGVLLKPVARNGLLCFGPNRGQSVTFVRPDQWIGGRSELDPDQALTEVARRYLHAYGPATKKDFAQWWGRWPGVGSAAWAGLAGELAQVSIEGLNAHVLTTDLDAIAHSSPDGGVQLLPAFDPYLMGHETRGHLVAAVHAGRVSRAAGWISAVVLVDGRVAGTWSHVVRGPVLRVAVDPFRRLAASTMLEVRRRADGLAHALGLTGAEVRRA